MSVAQQNWSDTQTDAAQAWTGEEGNRLESTQSGDARPGTISGSERTVSVAAGALLTILGLERHDLVGLLIAGVGGGLIYRGATGHCPVYAALGIDGTDGQQQQLKSRGTHVSESYLINKPARELYDYWRNFENLPRIMSHLESVTVIDEKKSHWVAKAPRIAGGQVEWDAEIVEDEPGKRIAWRSLAGAEVDNAGSVTFAEAPGDRGTKVSVVLDYIPPGGVVGALVAKLFGEAPEQQIREDLRKFKRVQETGESATIDGQPRGNCMGGGRRVRS